MRFKSDSDDTQEYPEPGVIHEKDLKMAKWSTRQYMSDQDGPEEWKAWDKSWKEQHPEWFPDKDGKPWDVYWDEYWRNKHPEWCEETV